MQNPFSSVCVIGLGYIGLPTASLLATRGFDVLGVDVDSATVETINRGDIHIYEPDLDILVRSAVNSGQLRAALTPAAADVFILAVPTPLQEGHKPDVSYVESATRAMAPHLASGNLVVLESTSPVGTTERVAEWIREVRPDLVVPEWRGECRNSDPDQIYVAHCPERVLPGRILKELVDNDRIVGGLDSASEAKARDFYAGFAQGRILTTDARTAELAKLTENAFRDVNIAFANELSLIADRLGIDVWELIELANHHPRVHILQPGPGVGGHCIAVDPWFIVSSCTEQARLIRCAREVNDSKPAWVMNKVREAIGERADAKVACLGLAFKPDVDDLRESPALDIACQLAEKGVGQVLAVEPYIEQAPERLLRAGGELVSVEEAIEDAEVVVLLVDHRPFRDLDASLLEDKTVIDTRGMWR